jgi:hypothetical protein
MKIPKTFVPEKNLEKSINKMLKSEKMIKHREIEDTFSLLELPKDLGDYTTYYEKIEDKKIPAYAWCKHFGDLFPQCLIEAGKVQYFKKSDLNKKAFVLSLNFSSDSELNSIIKRSNVAEEFKDPNVFEEFKDPKYKNWIIECLKKDNYMISIIIHKEVVNDLKLFKNWYIDNFGMIEI